VVVKVWIYADERYPDYGIDADQRYGVAVDLPDDFVARFKAATAEYEAVQDVLDEAVRQARKQP
jgi:hypothetical protein